MHKKQRPFRILVFLFLPLMVVSGFCGCRDSKPIQVGFVGPLTGKYADLGIAGRDGTLLAVEELNAAGGVGGRKIQLLVKDDGQNPERAKQVDQELVNAGVAAIIGHMTSAMSIAALPVINNAHVPMVSPTTSSNELSGIDDYFLRVYPPSSHIAAQLANYAFKDRRLNSITVAYDQSNQGHCLGWLNHFEPNYLRMGGKIIKVFPFSSGKQDFFALAKDIKAGGAEGLFVIAGAIDTAMICQHLRKQGSSIPVLVTEWSTTNDLLTHGGSSVEGLTFYQTFDRTCQKPTYVAFSKNYLQRFGSEPTFASVHAYDSAKLVFAGLAADPQAKNLKAAMIRIRNFSGLQNELTLDKYGDPTCTPFLMTVKGGSFQRVN